MWGWCSVQESQLAASLSREAAFQSKVAALQQERDKKAAELDDFVTRVSAAEERMKSVKEEVRRTTKPRGERDRQQTHPPSTIDSVMPCNCRQALSRAEGHVAYSKSDVCC